jgi:hypothetical protein
MTYGPYKLKAANSAIREGNYISQDPQGTAWMSQPSDFPTDITILFVHLITHFADGTPVSNDNGVYNHHVFVVDKSKTPVAHIGCAGIPIPIMPINSIMGNSAEATSELASGGLNLTTRPDTGNYVGKGHKMMIQLDLVNYNNKTENVYVTMDMSYIEGKGKGIWEIAQHLIPVGACAAVNGGGVSALMPPEDKKKWTLKDDSFVMRDTGKLIYIRGHMHGTSPFAWFAEYSRAILDGSVNMVFSLNGKQICDSRTEYNAPAVGEGQAGTQPSGNHHGGLNGGMMSGISICMNETAYKKGDKLSIAANYDLDLHPL